jgi:hypothetical protein
MSPILTSLVCVCVRERERQRERVCVYYNNPLNSGGGGGEVQRMFITDGHRYPI